VNTLPDSEAPAPQASPFHQGERAVQSRLGVRSIEEWARKVVRSYLPGQHRDFYQAQPFLITAARDAAGQPWVTMLCGGTGFVQSPDREHLVISTNPTPGDALENAFHKDADVGILGIEPATRRRNRVNGKVAARDGLGFTFKVEQSFGNCPQYIVERSANMVGEDAEVPVRRGTELSEGQQQWVTSADTFFIGSGFRDEGDSPSYGMDASHRGGEPGFVEVSDASCLRFPDYSGNNHYNTIGNLVLDPRVGLLFVDFATGSLLQVAGRASIDWEPSETLQNKGVRRVLQIDIEQVIELTGAIPMRWETDTTSLPLRLVDKIPESKDVTSFVFEAENGTTLPGFEPGQHLPIEIAIEGFDKPQRRTYSLSSAPGDAQYRISVKRVNDGVVSRHLHDHVEPGSVIGSSHPAGDFLMNCNLCPLVLVSAGVGVTPMVSILRAVTAQPSDRPVWFIHGARDGEHHPLADEVRQLDDAHPNIKVHVMYSRPRADDVEGVNYQGIGRVNGKLLAEKVSNTAAHYFLCGPTAFMAELQGELEVQSIPTEQIHYETFGPAS